MPRNAGLTYFLLTGATESPWRHQAKELRSKYRIETLAVHEHAVGPALVEFLERLTNVVAERAAAAAFDGSSPRRLRT